eukprot:gene232-250_t
MLAFVALLVTIASVSAFTQTGLRASSVRSQVALNAFAGGLTGGEGPELKNFDPLKFSEKSPEWVPFFREAEIKHSRIAMLATLGFIFADFVKLPGDVHQVSSAGAHSVAVQSGALVQVLLWVCLLEIISVPAVLGLGKTDREPGDFSFDPLKLGSKPADLARYKISELKNGRLAMLAIGGIATQAVLTGKGFPYF